MSAQLVRFHDGERWVCGLATAGHKYLHLVHIDDSGVRVLTQPKEQLRHAEPLLRKGQPYPVDRFVRHMKRVGKERGITARAQQMLDEVQS